MAADWRYQHDPTSSGYAFEKQINIEPLAFESNKRESYSLRASPTICQEPLAFESNKLHSEIL
jgi:hypothetical protein